MAATSFCEGIVSHLPRDITVLSVSALSTLLSLLLWRFGFGRANCIALLLCNAASFAVDSVEPFVLALGFMALKLAIAPDAYISDDNLLYISYPTDRASFRHWSVLVKDSSMPPNAYSEIHAVDEADGHVSTGRGKLVMKPIKIIDFTAGRRVVWVGYAHREWQKGYEQLLTEVKPHGRFVDNCQDYAISLAFHLSAFRIWTLVLSFKEFQRARVIIFYFPLLALSFAGHCLRRWDLSIFTPCQAHIVGIINPASTFLALVVVEVERLHMGTSTRNVNIWKYNWATWKRTWSLRKSMWITFVVVTYAISRPWLYKWATPMDFLIFFAVLVGVLTWINPGLGQSRGTKDRKSFSMPLPLFEPQKLGDYDCVSRTLPSSSFESFQCIRGIKSIPIGFDYDDLIMASQKNKPDKEKLEAFLTAPDDYREYQIGIAFVGRGNNKLGHAEIILRHGNLDMISPPNNLDLTTSPPIFASEKFAVVHDGQISPECKITLRALHLRNAHDGTDDLVLALEEIEAPRTVRYYRHANLYRIRMTERMLKHFALLSCPLQHRLLADDCATFAYNFLTRLLDHLNDRGDITEEVLHSQKELLVQHNHIADGSMGESEVISRQHENLGESGHSSVAAAMKLGAR